MKERNIAGITALNFVTLGLYACFWFHDVSESLKTLFAVEIPSQATAIFSLIIGILLLPIVFIVHAITLHTTSHAYVIAWVVAALVFLFSIIARLRWYQQFALGLSNISPSATSHVFFYSLFNMLFIGALQSQSMQIKQAVENGRYSQAAPVQNPLYAQSQPIVSGAYPEQSPGSLATVNVVPAPAPALTTPPAQSPTYVQPGPLTQEAYQPQVVIPTSPQTIEVPTVSQSAQQSDQANMPSPYTATQMPGQVIAPAKQQGQP